MVSAVIGLPSSSRRIGKFGKFSFSPFCKDFIHSPQHGVIVYPEGHRFKGEGTLNLKTGVMEVAYNLKVPCQIVLSNGKENVMDEISLKLNRGSRITVCVSDVLDPTKFDTKEAWFECVKQEWEKTYKMLEKNEVVGEEFFGSLPGVKKESLVDEIAPEHRRKTAISYSVGVLAVLVALVGLFRIIF